MDFCEILGFDFFLVNELSSIPEADKGHACFEIEADAKLNHFMGRDTTMPHIHFHITNNPVFNEGKGIPILFRDIVLNDVPMKNAIPKKGDVVSNNSR